MSNPKIKSEGSDGNTLYFGLLAHVAVLGVAVLRWMWKRDSERKIQEIKIQYNQDMTALIKELQKEQQIVKKLEQEKRHMWKSLLGAQEEGEHFQQKAQDVLEKLKTSLIHRQSIYCSYIAPRERRQTVEKELLHHVDTDPHVAKLVSKEDLNEIFQKDDYCPKLWNTDDGNNGKLMWLYLKYWQQQITLQKQKKVEEVLKEFVPNESN